MSRQIRREELRLRRIFEGVLLVAGATAAAVAPLACGTSATRANGTTSSGAGGATTTSSGVGGAATTSSAVGGATTTSSSVGGGGGGTVDAGDGGASICDPSVVTTDPPDPCGYLVRLPCGLPAGIATFDESCFLTLKDCAKLCTFFHFNCHVAEPSCVDAGTVVLDPDGGVTLDCATCPGGAGRVPAGLAPARGGRASSAIGAYFEAAAHLEAASVHAFRRLRDELGAHRAPARLIRAARAAQRDEVRHARLAARLARRFGGSPAAPRVASLPPRALADVAIENAVEGCVRETFGALLTSYQAAHATDAEIARTMAAIARDETRHAALSWAVDRWASRRLDAATRARLASARREAIEALTREADAQVDGDLAARAGLPGASERRALVAVLDDALWRVVRRERCRGG